MMYTNMRFAKVSQKIIDSLQILKKLNAYNFIKSTTVLKRYFLGTSGLYLF
jgi:hypothetical protein